MAITLSREAYLEFRCFGMADEYASPGISRYLSAFLIRPPRRRLPNAAYFAAEYGEPQGASRGFFRENTPTLHRRLAPCRSK